MKTRGVLVVGTGEFQNIQGEMCSPSRHVLQSGDYIQAVNGEAIEEEGRADKKGDGRRG